MISIALVIRLSARTPTRRAAVSMAYGHGLFPEFLFLTRPPYIKNCRAPTTHEIYTCGCVIIQFQRNEFHKKCHLKLGMSREDS